MTVTGYWASDMVNKMVYPNVLTLLNEKCPTLYANYVKLIADEKISLFIEGDKKNDVAVMPQKYLETDIYKASREIKKMQKLSSNILSTWYDGASKGNALMYKDNRAINANRALALSDSGK